LGKEGVHTSNTPAPRRWSESQGERQNLNVYTPSTAQAEPVEAGFTIYRESPKEGVRGKAVIGWRVRRLVVVMTAVGIAAVAAAAETLRPVRSTPPPDTTRLIVEFSAPVEHRLQRVAAHPDLGVPERLYIDFPGARLGDTPVPAQLPEGPMRRLRATQTDA